MTDALNQFNQRFGRLKEALGVITDIDLARALGIKQSSVASARERKSIPPKWIIENSDKHGISSDWLLYGEGPKYRSQARQIPAQPSPAVAAVYMDLIKEIVAIVEETLEQEEFHLPPKKKAELIVLLYEEFAEEEGRKEISRRKILRFARALVA
jgi:uncharacterized protein YjbJ (UPF0337 family)